MAWKLPLVLASAVAAALIAAVTALGASPVVDPTVPASIALAPTDVAGNTTKCAYDIVDATTLCTLLTRQAHDSTAYKAQSTQQRQKTDASIAGAYWRWRKRTRPS